MGKAEEEVDGVVREDMRSASVVEEGVVETVSRQSPVDRPDKIFCLECVEAIFEGGLFHATEDLPEDRNIKLLADNRSCLENRLG